MCYRMIRQCTSSWGCTLALRSAFCRNFATPAFAFTINVALNYDGFLASFLSTTVQSYLPWCY